MIAYICTVSQNEGSMIRYSVKKLAKLAGVSVRTLHLYDEIGLLKPAIRTEAKYRMYGENELLRLQQILFYKELDFPLQEIGWILDAPGFDLLTALGNHKKALEAKQSRIETLLLTIDKTMFNLKEGTMLKHEELYEGLSQETADAYRKEAIGAYGTEAVEVAEKSLRSLTKTDFEALKRESLEISSGLASMTGNDPTSEVVQRQIARHYEVIRKFWGTSGSTDPQAEAYKGLGDLYVNDERFTQIDGQPNPIFALFMQKAMAYFAETQLV